MTNDSEPILLDKVISSFIDLGGTFDNVRIENGQFGLGLFIADPKKISGPCSGGFTFRDQIRKSKFFEKDKHQQTIGLVALKEIVFFELSEMLRLEC